MSDLQEAYLDDMRTNVTQAVARKYLSSFCELGFLNKEKALRVQGKEVFVWSVPHSSVLDSLINPDLSEYMG